MCVCVCVCVCVCGWLHVCTHTLQPASADNKAQPVQLGRILDHNHDFLPGWKWTASSPWNGAAVSTESINRVENECRYSSWGSCLWGDQADFYLLFWPGFQIGYQGLLSLSSASLFGCVKVVFGFVSKLSPFCYFSSKIQNCTEALEIIHSKHLFPLLYRMHICSWMTKQLNHKALTNNINYKLLSWSSTSLINKNKLIHTPTICLENVHPQNQQSISSPTPVTVHLRQETNQVNAWKTGNKTQTLLRRCSLQNKWIHKMKNKND